MGKRNFKINIFLNSLQKHMLGHIRGHSQVIRKFDCITEGYRLKNPAQIIN